RSHLQEQDSDAPRGDDIEEAAADRGEDVVEIERSDELIGDQQQEREVLLARGEASPSLRLRQGGPLRCLPIRPRAHGSECNSRVPEFRTPTGLRTAQEPSGLSLT